MNSPYDNKDKTININHPKINNFLCDNFKFKKCPSRPLVSTGIAAIMTFIDLNKFENLSKLLPVNVDATTPITTQ
jgi:hypothetical protein